MPLYNVDPNKEVKHIKPVSFIKERDLQKLFEANLQIFLGVRYIASEFTTGDRQRGRIDTLGLDQDGYPTIIEYKKFPIKKMLSIRDYFIWIGWSIIKVISQSLPRNC